MLGKAHVLVVPKAIAIKLGEVAEGVPLAILGVTPEVAELLEMASGGDQRAIKGLSHLGHHPAFAALEQFEQAFSGRQLSRHESG